MAVSWEWEVAVKVVRMGELPEQPVNAPLFTGTVGRQVPLEAGESNNFNVGIVKFSAGSRNKFHKHTSDQILVVTEGTGVVATDDEEQTISVGDMVLIPAGENHWHGAPGETAMAHISIQAKGSTTTQIEP